MTVEHTIDSPAHISSQPFRRGYGTYEVALDRIGDEAYTDLLRQAIDLGYRHIDTAQQYQTEPHVADAIQRSKVDSDDVFVATKLHWSNLGYDDAIETALESKERLGVDTIDLLYIHVPHGTYDPNETLSALDFLVDDGVVDRIGVSNFLPEMLEVAIDRLDHPLFAHQVEMHPLLRQNELHQLAVDYGHWLVAFSPFMKGLIGEIRELRTIANRLDTTPHAVSLAWLMDQPNVAVLSHSKKVPHMRANLSGDLPILTDEDRDLIEGIDREYRMWDGRIDPWNRTNPPGLADPG